MQSSTGGLITTGGGFSSYYPQPAYQAAAVSAYFESPEGLSAQAGYNTEGRGYPDISFIGVYYPVIIGGTWHHLYGTSASAPLAAAMSTYPAVPTATLALSCTLSFTLSVLHSVLHSVLRSDLHIAYMSNCLLR